MKPQKNQTLSSFFKKVLNSQLKPRQSKKTKNFIFNRIQPKLKKIDIIRKILYKKSRIFYYYSVLI